MIATPLHLMKKTAVICTQSVQTQTDGAVKTTFGTAGAMTCRCSFQPAHSNESLQLQREMGVTTYDVWMAPTLSDGSATATGVNHATRIEVDSVRYKAIGDPLDLISEGCVIHLIVQKDS